MLDPISTLSKEYLKVPVFARDDTGIIDPTTGTIQFAFLQSEASPVSGTTWYNGTWETQTLNGLTYYKARCLIGPSGGAVTLVVGSYDVWIKIGYGNESVMRKVEAIKII